MSTTPNEPASPEIPGHPNNRGDSTAGLPASGSGSSASGSSASGSSGSGSSGSGSVVGSGSGSGSGVSGQQSRLAVSWLLVAVLLGYGIIQTLITAAKLFTS